MSRCVLVFGVSGVGKTTACKSYVVRHPDTLFVSASTLLKRAHRSTDEGLRRATSSKIIGNQDRLRDALIQFRAGRESMPVLVDAHAIIDNDVEFVRVPASIIRELAPDLLVLLEAPPVEVEARRARDSRQRAYRQIDEISRELEAERETVPAYASEIGLDLRVGEVGPNFRLEALLDASANKFSIR